MPPMTCTSIPFALSTPDKGAGAGVEANGISSIIFFFSHGEGVLTVLYAAWNCCSASMAFGDGRLSRSRDTFGRTSSNKMTFLASLNLFIVLL